MNKSQDKLSQKILKKRLDVLLVDKGLFDTREKARIVIMEGKVLVNNQKEDKAGSLFKEDAIISLIDNSIPYVSRGGLKLKKAIDVFHIELKDKVCLDIGASTGGFTDVMLKEGAKKVYAVDCGTNQLDYKLRQDERVVSLENLNARYMTKDNISNEDVDFISIDVSFISLKKIIPVVIEFLKNDRTAVFLIKPQFEVGKDKVGNGVIKDKKIHKKVIEDIINFCVENNLKILGLSYSPIKGPKGNIEYLLYVSKTLEMEDDKNDYINICENIVNESHEVLGDKN